MTGSNPDQMRHDVQIRDVREDDLPIFFEHQTDEEANHMAAFTAKDPTDREAFMTHWTRILSDETTINMTILYDGQVAGHVSSYEEEPGRKEVTYWLGKSYWGQGIATRALSALLHQLKERPVYARTAKDNLASLRVLEKCGFTIIGEDRGFANARGQEIEEYHLQLRT